MKLKTIMNMTSLLSLSKMKKGGFLVMFLSNSRSASINILRDFGEIEAECIGDRFNSGHGKGLEFPVDYRLIGNYRYLKRLIRRLKIKEFAENLNISDIRKCYDV